MVHDISIILPTYNRAELLRRTLEGMVKMEKGDLSVELIVVDNASTDQTKNVIESFSDRLKIRYLFEPRSGKSRALNCALEKGQLGDIVVFTDDDVDVSPDWIVSIASICNRWPNHSVFGGRINIIFPYENIPKWTSDPFIKTFGFSYQNYSTHECVYNDRDHPFGPNYWVRRSVFSGGRRFDESIGPHPTNRTLGDETKFLLELLNEGYELVYSPRVVVGHRIQPEALKFTYIYSRAYQLGRSFPHIRGLPHRTLLKNHYAMWYLHRSAVIIWNAFKVLCAIISISEEKRVCKGVRRIQWLGYHIEAMHMARNKGAISS